MTTAPEYPKWPSLDTKNIGDEVRTLKTRLRLLELEIKEGYRALNERINELEIQLDEFING